MEGKVPVIFQKSVGNINEFPYGESFHTFPVCGTSADNGFCSLKPQRSQNCFFFCVSILEKNQENRNYKNKTQILHT